MLKISKDGVSVIAVLDRRRAKKSGVFPVKIEVVYNRIQKYYPTVLPNRSRSPCLRVETDILL